MRASAVGAFGGTGEGLEAGIGQSGQPFVPMVTEPDMHGPAGHDAVPTGDIDDRRSL